MSEAKDPAIKLFGTTIPLSGNEDTTAALSGDSGSAFDAIPVELEDNIDHDLPLTTYSDDDINKKSNKMEEDQQQQQQEEEKDKLEDISTENKEDGAPPPDSNQPTVPAMSSGTDENPKTPADKETATPDVPKAEEGHGEANNSQDRTLKKPDKILPCPRCNSMDTKFCYYNNYNVNQPRHFCKNCQRYWTAGGTMRNVPVGAGRRKTKSSSNYRHFNVPEALQTIRSYPSDGIHHPPKPNATVLTFGSDTPLSESMASALSLAEKTMSNCTSNGFHRPAEQRISVSCGGGEMGDDYSCGTSVMGSNSTEEGNNVGLQDAVMRNCHGFPPQMPCFPGAPWSYPWNPTQWNPAVPPPAFCPPSFPVSFYPTPAYWGCAVPGTWNVPWFLPPPSTSPGVPASGPNSPTLGKHSRDGNMLKQCNSEQEDPIKQGDSERCLWIPKTLRIDDPVEAARSSIWATLGIKNDKADSSGGGLFQAFQSKGDEKNHRVESSHVLQANPAALSRSLNFHENS